MKKKLLLMLTLCLLAQWSVAQAPKWVDKAKRAVFSVVTYDHNCFSVLYFLRPLHITEKENFTEIFH